MIVAAVNGAAGTGMAQVATLGVPMLVALADGGAANFGIQVREVEPKWEVSEPEAKWRATLPVAGT